MEWKELECCEVVKLRELGPPWKICRGAWESLRVKRVSIKHEQLGPQLKRAQTTDLHTQ